MLGRRHDAFQSLRPAETANVDCERFHHFGGGRPITPELLTPHLGSHFPGETEMAAPHSCRIGFAHRVVAWKTEMLASRVMVAGWTPAWRACSRIDRRATSLGHSSM